MCDRNKDNVPNVQTLLGRFEKAPAAQKPEHLSQAKAKGPSTVKGPPFSLNPKSIKAPPSQTKSSNSRPVVASFQKELADILKTPKVKPTPGRKVPVTNSPRPPLALPSPIKSLPTPPSTSVPTPPEKPKKKSPTPAPAIKAKPAVNKGPTTGSRADWPTDADPPRNIGPRDDSIPSTLAPPAPNYGHGTPLVVNYRGKRLPDTVVINGSLYRLSPVSPTTGGPAPHTPDRPCEVLLSPQVLDRAKIEIEEAGYDNSMRGENERIPEITEKEEFELERSRHHLVGPDRAQPASPIHSKGPLGESDEDIYDDTADLDDDYEDVDFLTHPVHYPWPPK